MDNSTDSSYHSASNRKIIDNSFAVQDVETSELLTSKLQTQNGIKLKPSKKDRGKPLRQIIVAIIANLGTINTGLVFGFSAVALEQLKSKESDIQINDSQESWIASLSSLSTPVGCILSGYLMDKIGRKLTLILTEIPLIIGWILIAAANNVYLIYAGRLFTGLGSGMVGAPVRVYTSEVTQPHLRGMLGALASVGISFGVMFQYILGSHVTWRILSSVSAIIPSIALGLILFVPESPNFLITKLKPEDATKSLAKLRGSSYDVEGEIQNMRTFSEKRDLNRSMTFKETFQELLKPTALKPFGILVLYFLMYQFSGVNAITFYAERILGLFEKSDDTVKIYLEWLGIIRLIATIAACIALRRCGKRPLTFISCIGCGSTMIGLGVYKIPYFTWDFPWFPVLCIFLFQISCTIGFLVVPWVMIGEIYPTKVRGILGGFTTCAAHMFVFAVVKSYQTFIRELGYHGTFIAYGLISLSGFVLLYFLLPETKGKTLQEIEVYFSSQRSNNNNNNNQIPINLKSTELQNQNTK